MNIEPKENGPSAPQEAESFDDIIGYRGINPESKNAEGGVITSFEPKVEAVEFWDILFDLHLGKTALLDREAADDVISRIDDLDPSDCWSLYQSECEDNRMELELLSPDEIVLDMLLREPMATEREIIEHVQRNGREEINAEAKDPPTPESDSLTDIIGYRTLDPKGNDSGIITSFEPEVEALVFREVLEELHRGKTVLFDREAAADVRERIDDLDPTDSWMLSAWECDDDKVELHMIGDAAILLRLSTDPSFTEKELRLAVEYRSWEG